MILLYNNHVAVSLYAIRGENLRDGMVIRKMTDMLLPNIHIRVINEYSINAGVSRINLSLEYCHY